MEWAGSVKKRKSRNKEQRSKNVGTCQRMAFLHILSSLSLWHSPACPEIEEQGKRISNKEQGLVIVEGGGEG